MKKRLNQTVEDEDGKGAAVNKAGSGSNFSAD
jgi:hypothetical protein